MDELHPIGCMGFFKNNEIKLQGIKQETVNEIEGEYVGLKI